MHGPFIEAGYPGGIIIENIPAPLLMDGWITVASPFIPETMVGGGYTGPLSSEEVLPNPLT